MEFGMDLDKTAAHLWPEMIGNFCQDPRHIFYRAFIMIVRQPQRSSLTCPSHGIKIYDKVHKKKQGLLNKPNKIMNYKIWGLARFLKYYYFHFQTIIIPERLKKWSDS